MCCTCLVSRNTAVSSKKGTDRRGNRSEEQEESEGGCSCHTTASSSWIILFSWIFSGMPYDCWRKQGIVPEAAYNHYMSVDAVQKNAGSLWDDEDDGREGRSTRKKDLSRLLQFARFCDRRPHFLSSFFHEIQDSLQIHTFSLQSRWRVLFTKFPSLSEQLLTASKPESKQTSHCFVVFSLLSHCLWKLHCWLLDEWLALNFPFSDAVCTLLVSNIRLRNFSWMQYLLFKTVFLYYSASSYLPPTLLLQS